MLTEVVDLSTSKQTLILVGDMLPEVASLLDTLRPHLEILPAKNMQDALELSKQHPKYRLVEFHETDSTPSELLFWPKIFDHYPDGVAITGHHQQILWHNQQFAKYLQVSQLTGKNIQDVISAGQILDNAKSPLTIARLKGIQASATVKFRDKFFCELTVIPITGTDAENQIKEIIFLRDSTSFILQQQKLDAIFKAMSDFGEITPEDLARSLDERVDILKECIKHHTEHTLEYHTIEIRLLDHTTLKLEPLLAVGMDPEAEKRELYARVDRNGITGRVAATGKSYLCENIQEDPNYLPGAPGANSSITVPLLLHDQILGTLNVENCAAGAFTNFDLKFLELFGREVSIGLNNLNLLAHQKSTGSSESCSLLLKNITTPVDEILQNTCQILDQYKGDDPRISEKLHLVLGYARDIREHIFNVEEQFTPDNDFKYSELRKAHPLFKNKRVLYTEADVEDRKVVTSLLQKYGAFVEIAHNGEEALALARKCRFDLIFINISLPDTIGYNLYVKLKLINQHIPIIFVKGYGYDRHHNIPDGNLHLHAKLAISKPIKPDLLITAAENALTNPAKYSPPLPEDLRPDLYEKS